MAQQTQTEEEQGLTTASLVFILSALVLVPLSILGIGKLIEWKFAVRKKRKNNKIARMHTVASWVQGEDLHKQTKPRMTIDDPESPTPEPKLPGTPPEHYNLGSPDLVVPSASNSLYDSSITGDSQIIKPKKMETTEAVDETAPQEPVEYGYVWKPVRIMTDAEVKSYIRQQDNRLTNTEKLVQVIFQSEMKHI